MTAAQPFAPPIDTAAVGAPGATLPARRLSPGEVSALRAHFPTLIDTHYDSVVRQLGPLERSVALREAGRIFLGLFHHITEAGYPESVAAYLQEQASTARDRHEAARSGTAERDAFVSAILAKLPEPPLPPFPALTLDKYASLCAEIALAPDRRLVIGLKYGVPSPAVHDALDADWCGRLTAEQALALTFRVRLEEYIAWLQAQPG